MNRIKARLQKTSESWIASIILVVNLVKLAGEVPRALILALLTFSAQDELEFMINLRMRLIWSWEFQPERIV